MAGKSTNNIQIKNVNQGGISDSDYLGALNSVAEIVGINIHDEAGIMKLNQRLTKDSGTTVDAFVRAGVSASNGNSYLFGANGKCFKRTSGGTWSVLFTASPAAGSAAVLSAWEYQGYVYYAMQSRLGRFDLATETNADSWATFGVTDADYHPMRVVNQVLYIGDGNQVAQVDAGVFSANALDIKQPLRISALGKFSTDLLIGTFVASNVVGTEVLRWNTWSDSFSVSDTIPEVGVNCFLETDNAVVVNCGTKGNLYLYNGRQLEEQKQIKGTWGNSTNKAIVYDSAKLNFHGLPLFGLSQQNGTGVNLGVYSFGRTNANYPYVLALEFPLSTGNLTNVKIGALVALGDQFLVAWQDDNSGTTYGVDILDLSNKYATGYITTRISLFDRIRMSTYRGMQAAYRLLPSGTGIQFWRNLNHAGFTQITTGIKPDDKRKIVESENDTGEASAFQARFVLEGSGNDSPEVELFNIEVI